MKIRRERRRRFGHAGTAVIETLASLSFLVPALIGGMSCLYFVFARVWIDRAGYEALICLSTDAPVDDCKAKMMRSNAAALPLGAFVTARLSRTRFEARADVRFEIAGFEIIHYERKQRLPFLRATRGGNWR